MILFPFINEKQFCYACSDIFMHFIIEERGSFIKQITALGGVIKSKLHTNCNFEWLYQWLTQRLSNQDSCIWITRHVGEFLSCWTLGATWSNFSHLISKTSYFFQLTELSTHFYTIRKTGTVLMGLTPPPLLISNGNHVNFIKVTKM